jgi:hypothetical protein
MNQKDGTFREEAALRGAACNALGKAQANMGVAFGDINGDGLGDLFVTHLTDETNTLWQQGPCGLFRDRTAGSGLADAPARGTGFGTVLADFDLDGALDIAVANGRVYRSQPVEEALLGPFWCHYGERNRLFAGDGRGRFRDISAHNTPLCGTAGVARGLAWGDINGDGAVDLVVTNIAGRARVYYNVAPRRGHWLLVRALDPALRRDAYGATVTVEAGGLRRVGWVLPGQSYLCSNDPRVHFGLGPATEVNGIHVAWPDGSQELFPPGAVDRVVVVRKGEGKVAPARGP